MEDHEEIYRKTMAVIGSEVSRNFTNVRRSLAAWVTSQNRGNAANAGLITLVLFHAAIERAIAQTDILTARDNLIKIFDERAAAFKRSTL